MHAFTPKEPAQVEMWKRRFVECPKQNNYMDCGVFVCYFANFVGVEAPLDFGPRDISSFRLRMTSDILRQKIDLFS